MSMVKRVFWLIALSVALAAATYAVGQTALLPPGTSFGGDRLDLPRRAFYSEIIGGRRSTQSIVGDLLFEAPSLFGGTARKAGISCGSCHIQGTTNAELFIPGLSRRPGTFDPAGPLFNPQTDVHVLNALTVPNLRGARYLWPFGHDGRFPSLRDFARNAIVTEFAGPEPGPAAIDALVAFIQDLALLPNRRLGPDGGIASASASELRGEAIFNRPFPDRPSMTCATCHVPSGAFVDHQQHDVGTGLYKTPTLRGANFNAPYFHDGRFDTYGQVVDYFDDWFRLSLSAAEKADLIAYLNAIGDGDDAFERASPQAAAAELQTAAEGLAAVVHQRDWGIVSIAADGFAHKVHAVQQFYIQPQGESAGAEGTVERTAASAALADIVLELLRVQRAAETQDEVALTRSAARIDTLVAAIAGPLLRAEPWSLFNPAIMARHRLAISHLDTSGPSQKAR
jgi:cytochrome c peroxidase